MRYRLTTEQWCNLGLCSLVGIIVAVVLFFQPFSVDGKTDIRMALSVVSDVAGPGIVELDYGDENRRLAFDVPFDGLGAPQIVRKYIPSGWLRKVIIRFPEGTTRRHVESLVIATGADSAERISFQYSESPEFVAVTPARLLWLRQPWDPSDWEIGVVSLVGGILAYLILRFSRPYVPRLQGVFENLRVHCERRHHVCFIAVSVLAVLFSCFPVVFLGKSLVSPNNGSPMFYAGHPSFPGITDNGFEGYNYIDVHCTPMSHLPYSAVEHDAIFRDHEFPLWLRHTNCGTTLVGQRIPMTCDPLHLLPIVTRGTSWAWDLKFCLAKFVFCLGACYLAYLACGSIFISGIIGLSVAFIGFFVYRFNHTAYFSMCYAPWLFYCWVQCATSTSFRGAFLWALWAILFNWSEFHTGTGKESAFFIGSALVFGLGYVIWYVKNVDQRLSRLALIVCAFSLFMLLIAPFLSVFLHALKGGATFYDAPEVFQLSPVLTVSLFDDIFARRLAVGAWLANPSANFLLLIGVLWFIAGVNRSKGFPSYLLIFGALVALFAFGVVPPEWLKLVPFVKNVHHLDNLLSCILIVLMIPAAAYGLMDMWNLGANVHWWQQWKRSVLLGAVITIGYFGGIQAQTRFGGLALKSVEAPELLAFTAFSMAAVLILIPVLPLLVRMAIRHRHPLWLMLLMVSGFLIHFRFAYWGDTKFDQFVCNPRVRVDLHTETDGIRFLKQSREPERMQGAKDVLVAGFQAMYGLESIRGADPIAEKHWAEWYHAAKLGGWNWTRQELELRDLADPLRLRIMDALNVGMYVTMPKDRTTPPGLSEVHSSDLRILHSGSVWPRAFFSDSIIPYASADDLVHLIKEGDGRPFVAIQAPSDSLQTASVPDKWKNRVIVPGTQYNLRSSRTSFTVDCPKAGFALLLEKWMPDSFRAWVDGVPAEVLRVNHCFKAVRIPSAGVHRVEFQYHPKPFFQFVWLFWLGLGLYIAGIGWFVFSKRSKAGVVAEPVKGS